MKKLLHARGLHITIATLLIGVALFSLLRATSHEEVEYVTATVERGDVTEIISVSGSIKADDTAALAFPVGGIIADITISEGDTVSKGQLLASLTQADLLANRQDAYATLQIARADRDELLRGPRAEERTITDRTVSIAEENLNRIVFEQEELLANARRTLLSSDLAAIPDSKNNDDIPPVITGSYTCEPGVYEVDVFGSEAASGYSYRLSGLERGTFTAHTGAAAPLGSCGLAIQFIDGVHYGSSDWTITIPNTLGSSYTANLNAYDAAVNQHHNTIEAAEESLLLAREEAVLANADPRSEAVARADARVLQAEARLAAIDAQLTDRIIVAPFDGTITEVTAVEGESLGTAALITMVANDTFKLKARIPEIDITKIEKGLPAAVIFDARVEEVLPATVTFISPLAIEIDGVAYFEATLTLTEPPTWIRSGLNADIDIEIHKEEGVLRIPKRFITTEEDGTHTILIPQGETPQTRTVEAGFVGNDGFVEITGVNEGDTIIAP